MPDEQSQPSPEQEPQRRGHPLTDAPPPQTTGTGQQRRVNIRFPGTVRVPRVTYVLIGLNLLIWIMIQANRQLALELLNWGILNSEAVITQRQVHRLVTAMFLHIEFYHVAFNCLGLYYIGSNVERFFGPWRYLLIYLLGGVAGSIASLYFYANSLGASGGVFAIWGAEAVFFYRHRKLFGAMAMQRLRSTGFFILFNFAIGFAANISGTVAIGNIAHLGGLLGGGVLAWLIGPRFLAVPINKPQQGQVPVRIVQANPLRRRIQDVLLFAVGLAGLLLLAIVIGT